ncbi:hypothetical protein E2C01_036731 [Portunus trituberculatus]|uniref:Uncharacterized protein n=1 Tax=Portunus trituberculatus TaxID=210409 RepID=A0A5B7FF46_PORTR|nr:hypothetical protein [Portunus trituberculatus]
MAVGGSLAVGRCGGGGGGGGGKSPEGGSDRWAARGVAGQQVIDPSLLPGFTLHHLLKFLLTSPHQLARHS